MNFIRKLLNCFKYNHHGKHVFADFIWNTNSTIIDDKILAETVFQIMEDAIKKTNMTIVHKKLCILGKDSPPGFTSILLLDESHCSAHCYSDRGWLCLDCFTCGNTDPFPIMEYIIMEIKKKYPTLECTYLQKHKRFHYR
jgi:S-adenosylmethionine decarboxylase